MAINVTPIPKLTAMAAPSFTLGTANAAGNALTAVASNSTLLAFDAVAVDAITFGQSGSVGTATVAPRRDHVHAMEAETPVSTTGIAKGYAYINSAGVATGKYNVNTSARDATGDFSVTWETDFSDTNYIVSFMGDAGTAYSWINDGRAADVTGYKTFNNTDDGVANLGGSIVVFGAQ